MAIAALNSAATGLKALSTRIDVVANNLANAETTAFKRSRANFEDLFYITLRQPGTLNAAQQVTPAGLQIGLGVKISNTQLDLEQGSIDTSGRALDVAIEGAGFFRVITSDGIGDGFAYTRNGNFFINNEGELVLGMGDGYRLDPPVSGLAGIAEDRITIAQDGTISVIPNGQLAPQQVGQLQIARFSNPQGLKNLGGSLYQQTESSGAPVITNPIADGAGKILQGYLEGSNVDPVKELVTLIKTQRSFELNSQSIQTADQALQTVANLRRF